MENGEGFLVGNKSVSAKMEPDNLRVDHENYTDRKQNQKIDRSPI